MYKSVEKKHPVFCIDLFAGAGGLSLAAENVGFNIKVAVEINNHACSTYKDNIIKGKQHITLYQNDILDLCPEDIFKRHFKSIGGCDLVVKVKNLPNSSASQSYALSSFVYNLRSQF